MAQSVTIYHVFGGSIQQNSNSNHYKIYSNDLQQIHVSVLNVTPNDSGLYKTVSIGQNTVDGCCLLIITDKPTKPKLTYDKHPFVGFQTELTCKSVVRRWPSDPASSLFYRFPDIGEQYNNMLTINVTKSNKGNKLSCTATDDKSKISDSSNVITLDPYYGPVSVSISPPASHVDVTEGEKLHPITCSADCNPNCNYAWKHNTKKFKDGKMLNIDSVARKHYGIYRCRVTHPNSTIRVSYPNSNRRFLVIDVNVNVLYPPSFKSLEIGKGTSSFKDYSTKYIKLKEEDRIFVKMSIESNPKPRLYFNSQSFPKTELQYNVSNNYYTAELPSLKCEDSDQYTIEANNSINSTKRMVQLIIQCKPKKTKTERQKIGTQINALENVTITVVANPKPTVQWLKYTGFTWEMEQSGTDFNYMYKLTSAVQIKDESMFGQYRVRIDNSVGSAIVNITLVPKDKPQPPRNVSIFDIFPYKASLSWIAGFDGGDEQYFLIKYKQSNAQSLKTIDLKQTGVEEETALFYTFTGLAPSTLYDIYIIAKNSYGERRKSIKFFTLAAPVPVEKSGDTKNAIIYTLVGLVVVIITAFSVGIICNRHRQSRNNVAVQENRRETGNESYVSLHRTDLQNVNHEDTYTELVEPGNANGSKAADNVDLDKYMEIIDDKNAKNLKRNVFMKIQKYPKNRYNAETR